MSLFKKKSSVPRIDFDPTHMRPVLQCNTCNSERVAGFQDDETGKFTEVMYIRYDYELEDFKKAYGLDNDIKEIYTR